MGAPAMSRRSSSTHQTKSPRGQLWRRNSDGSKRYNPKTSGFVWKWWLMMEKKHEHLVVGSLAHPDFSQMAMYSIYWVPNFQTNPCCFPRLYMCSCLIRCWFAYWTCLAVLFGGADLDFDPDSRDSCFNARKTRFADVNLCRLDACCW